MSVTLAIVALAGALTFGAGLDHLLATPSQYGWNWDARLTTIGSLNSADPAVKALEADPAALGVTKIDLGAEWTAMTGWPFIYAAWTGRAGAIGAAEVTLLQEAQDEGVASYPAIAGEYGNGNAVSTQRALAYLRDNMRYGLGPDEVQGLQMFLDYAADLGLAPRRRRLEFF